MDQRVEVSARDAEVRELTDGDVVTLRRQAFSFGRMDGRYAKRAEQPGCEQQPERQRERRVHREGQGKRAGEEGERPRERGHSGAKPQRTRDEASREEEDERGAEVRETERASQ